MIIGVEANKPSAFSRGEAAFKSTNPSTYNIYLIGTEYILDIGPVKGEYTFTPVPEYASESAN